MGGRRPKNPSRAPTTGGAAGAEATKKARNLHGDQDALRRAARKRLADEAHDVEHLAPQDARRLVEELRIHEIELEIQNEELRRTQEELLGARDRFADLYDFAPIGYVTVSAKGLILEANLTLADLLGVARGRLLKTRFTSFVGADGEDAYYLHRQEVLRTRRRATCRVQMLGRDAEPFWAELDSIPATPADPADDRLMTVVNDVSRRVEAEEAKRSLERQVQQVQKLESLGLMAGGIAHDFNNLLAVIVGNADVALEMLPAGSPVRNPIADIRKASDCAADLIMQMLSYAGKGTIILESVDLAETTRDIAHLLEVAIPKTVDVRYEFAADLPSFKGDRTQFRQVVMNLMTNAAEAMAAKSGLIVVRTGVMECDRAYLEDIDDCVRAGLDLPLPTGRYVYLEVSDNGRGMDGPTLQKIFDPFYTTKFTGRGLGLSAVLGIMRSHKGLLKIRSEIGSGTTVRVLFRAEPAVRNRTHAPDRAAAAAPSRRGRTVLVVEDEPTVFAVAERMLDLLELKCLCAADGREALEILERIAGAVDVVLLDLVMPRMGGEETFHEIRARYPHLPVVLCSGYGEAEIARRFGDEVPDALLRKPYSLAALRAALQDVLEPHAG